MRFESLNRRIALVFGAVLVLVAVEIGLIVTLAQRTSDEAAAVRLASIERGRTHRLVKEVLLLDRADSQAARDELSAVREAFQQTLTALRFGGEGVVSNVVVGVTPETLTVPAAEGELADALAKADGQWQDFDGSLKAILSNDSDSVAFDAAVANLVEVSETFPASFEQAADVAQRSLNSSLDLLRLSTLLGAGVIGVVLVASWLWARRKIVRPIEWLERTTRRIAEGDLTTEVPTDDRADEIGRLTRSFGEMTVGLRRNLAGLRDAVGALSSSSTEIVAAVNQLTSGATEESAAVAQIGSTADEVRTTAEQATERARAVADAAGRTAEVAADGQSAVAAARSEVSDVAAKVDTIAQRIMALSERTQAIGEIVSTVNDLADQSNLLAVNAAIEAAKAGEHGRGFAVVAQEVRALADQSRAATAQVATILGDIQKAANGAVIVTEQGTKGAAAAVERINEAGGVIDQLAGTIEEAANLARQIAATTGQQRVGVDQIATGIGNVSVVSNQTVSAARQLQQEAEGLAELARHLEGLAGQYRLTEGGAGSGAPRASVRESTVAPRADR
jgi:methyl-accepting chemotaxis protein